MARRMSACFVLLIALTLFLVSPIVRVESQGQDTANSAGGNGVQDTMYDLEGSAEDQTEFDDEYESGSGGVAVPGSGSGSGEGLPGGKNLNCQLPPRGTFPEPADFESDILPEIQCHLACIEHVMRDENVTLQISANYIWPTVHDSALEEDCSIYQKVEECKQGCLIRKLQPSLKEGRCALQCNRICNQDCSETPQCWIKGSMCNRKCSESSCQDGCQLYISEIRQANGDVPDSPTTKPHLFAPRVATGAGIYTVDPGSTSSNLSALENSQLRGNGEADGTVTGFVFRVLHEVTNGIAFFWLRTLDDELNLGAFSCTNDVIVQYAAVNKYGRSSRWSPATEIDVYGADGIPSPENPDTNSIRFHVRPDERFGFWKHAVIMIFWDRPRGFHFVDHFLVTLHPSSYTCGRRQVTLTVPRELTRAQIQAQNPHQGPVDGCTYEISVVSVGVPGMSVPLARKVLFNVDISNPVPIGFKCSRVWSDVSGTFQFQINWTIPDSQYLHNAIKVFNILLSFNSPGARPENRDSTKITFEKGQSDYHFSTKPVRYGLTGSYYRMHMDTRSTLPDKILVPKLRTCEFDATPPSPDPPAVVSVNNNSIVYQSVDVELGMGLLTLELEWNGVGGNISSYEISLVELGPPAANGEQVVLETFHPQQLQMAKQSALVSFEVPTSTQDGCLYVQVRSISGHGTISNWSDPHCVFITGLSLPTGQPPEATPTRRGDTTPTSPVLEVPLEMLYIILSVAGVVLVATVILTFFVCLACYQNRRASKKAKLFQLQQAKQSSLQKSMSPSTTPTKLSYQSPKLLVKGGKPFPSVSLTKSAEDWELHPCQIVIEDNLGQGGFGDIYQGTIRGGVGIYKSNGPQIMRVAVKILRANSSVEEKRAFLDHIEQAKLVTNQLTTSHVVKMVGCVTLHEPHCLITELPARGDLLTYLVHCRANILNPKKKPEQEHASTLPFDRFMELGITYSGFGSVLPQAAAAPAITGVSFRETTATVDYKVEPKDLLNFAVHIASGMEYLSGIGVVHGDLACRNMYLDENRTVKISDFGINIREKGKHRLYVKVGQTRLPLRWMAPEAITEGKLSVASDIWAVGVTLWEIVTLGGFPYIDVSNKDLLQSLQNGTRLEQPPNCSLKMYKVMEQCWDREELNRPTFNTLHEILQELSTSEDLSSHVSLQNIDPQRPYYHPRRHHGSGVKDGKATEEDITRQKDEIVHDILSQTEPDAHRMNSVSTNTESQGILQNSDHTLPKIVEDKIGEKIEERSQGVSAGAKEEKTSSSKDHLKQIGGDVGSKDTSSMKDDRGLGNGACAECDECDELSTEEAIQAVLDQTEVKRSETTSPDSGCNLSES